jgi:RES domain-containing protein
MGMWERVTVAINPHPDFDRFAATCVALVQNAAEPGSGVGFRFAALKYAKSGALVSGAGAKRSGGRVNAVGTFRVIYTSMDPQTASAETYQKFASFGFKHVRPMVVVGIEIKLTAILDLCQEGLRRRLNVTLEDLAQPWWPVQEAGNEALTQALGRAAFEAGFEAVMLPSVARKGGINLNVFPEKLRPESSLAVLAEEDLQQYLK